MRIAAAAQRLGISADWMRRLEKAGRLPKASRDLSGHRRYTEHDLQRLQMIIMGRGQRGRKHTEKPIAHAAGP